MPTELKMPALSPTMEEGTLAKWLVKEGDAINSGDIIAEIETDKATMEFEAVDEGTLLKIMVDEGTDNVAVGTVIGMIGEEGEEVGDVAPAEDRRESDRRDGDRRKEDKGSDADGNDRREGDRRQGDRRDAPEAQKGYGRDEAPAPDTKAPPAPVKDGERVKASPLARRLAEAQGIDLTTISGSGPGGRIVRADLGKGAGGAAAAPAASAPAPTPQATSVDPGDIPHEVEKLSNMRKTIARRLTESKQQVPHIYLTVDINLDKLLKLRSEMNAGLEARGVKLSVNDLLIKALAVALMEVPECNVSFGDGELIKYQRADISVAVSIPNGLITPIIAGANDKSLSKISTEMKELAERAKEGKLQPHEYQGGTASLSNMGMFGIKQFDAVINPPQAMIMAVSAGEKRPYVVDDSLQIATVMSATGSFDHRAIDGADGAKLMKVFKQLVENPLGMVA